MSDTHQALAVTVAIAAALAAVLVAVLVATVRPAPVAVLPDCLEYTDNCVVCRRELLGAPAACSTPGIACVRQAPRCLSGG